MTTKLAFFLIYILLSHNITAVKRSSQVDNGDQTINGETKLFLSSTKGCKLEDSKSKCVPGFTISEDPTTCCPGSGCDVSDDKCRKCVNYQGNPKTLPNGEVISPGQKMYCENSYKCCPDEYCRQRSQDNNALCTKCKAKDSNCKYNWQCCSFYCNESVCDVNTTCLKFNNPCSTPSECCSNICYQGKCANTWYRCGGADALCNNKDQLCCPELKCVNERCKGQVMEKLTKKKCAEKNGKCENCPCCDTTKYDCMFSKSYGYRICQDKYVPPTPTCADISKPCDNITKCCSPYECIIQGNRGRCGVRETCRSLSKSCDKQSKCCSPLICNDGYCEEYEPPATCSQLFGNCDSQTKCCAPNECVVAKMRGTCQKPYTPPSCIEEFNPCDNTIKCCGDLECLSLNNRRICSKVEKCSEINKYCDSKKKCCSPLICKDGYCEEYKKPVNLCINQDGVCESNSEYKCCNPLICTTIKNRSTCQPPKPKCLDEGIPCEFHEDCCKNQGLNCYEYPSGPGGKLIKICNTRPFCSTYAQPCKESVNCCVETPELECSRGYCQRCKGRNKPCTRKNECCPDFGCYVSPLNGKDMFCLDVEECMPVGVSCLLKSCCQGYKCIDGTCMDCKNQIKEGVCEGSSECCKGFFCYYDFTGVRKFCMDQPKCIKVAGTCSDDQSENRSCCTPLQCINGKCKSCISLKASCKTNSGDPCCYGSCIFSSNGIDMFCSEDNQNCIDIGGTCDMGSNPTRVCCDNKRCENRICSDCLLEGEQGCSEKVRCCSGFRCLWDVTGSFKSCRKDQSTCIDLDGLCNDTDGRICCSKALVSPYLSLRCIDGMCSDCFPAKTDCEKFKGKCCQPNACFLDETGVNYKCLDKPVCFVIRSPCANDHDCCDELHCLLGKCTDCQKENEECKDKPNCCPNLSCSWDSLGKTKLCQTGDTCIALTGLCDGYGKKCCPHLKCIENPSGIKICQDCLAKGLECARSALKCCPNSDCKYDDMGSHKICREDGGCIVTGGKCSRDDDDMKCCSDYCDYDKICRKCIAKDMECTKTPGSLPCCDKRVCTWDALGSRQICSDNRNSCINLNGSCNEAEQKFCCTTPGVLICVKGICLNCKLSGICMRNEDCCGDLICHPNDQATALECMPNDPGFCIKENGYCGEKLPEQFKNLKCCDRPSKLFCVDNICRSCKSELTPCLTDSECCDGSCQYSRIADKKICSTADQCRNNHSTCEFDGNDPKCCPEFRCKSFDGGPKKCRDCKDPLAPCSKNNDCCEGICQWDENGRELICQKEQPTPCIRISQDCTKSPRSSIPKLCCDEAQCINGKCTICIKPNAPCSITDKCCQGSDCFMSSDGIYKCLPNAECITKGNPCESDDGKVFNCCEKMECFNKICSDCKPHFRPCSEDKDCCDRKCGLVKKICLKPGDDDCKEIEQSCTRTEDCCPGNELVCHKSLCSRCIPDGNPCSNTVNCCSGSCGNNSKGQKICGTSVCIDELDIPCQTKGGEPRCCSDKDLHCYHGKCSNCKFEGVKCEGNIECCEKNCYWNENGTSLVCTQRDCLDDGKSCMPDPTKPEFPKKCCNPRAICYSNVCRECIKDDLPCETNPEKCCSNHCDYNSKGVMVCIAGGTGTCVQESYPCRKNLKGIRPECCPDLECFNDHCKKCTKLSSVCVMGEKPCCEGKCYWDEDGTSLTCNKRKCLEKEGAQCGPASEPNEPPRICCPSLTCYKSTCLKTCKLDGKPCRPEGDTVPCCSGNCNIDSTGNFICKENPGNDCVSEEYGDCDKANRLPECCNELTCWEHKCRKCKPNDSPCVNPQDCCSRNCFWNSNSMLICQPPNIICQKQDSDCEPHSKSVPPKSCCPNLVCYDGTCKSCTDDGQPCTFEDKNRCCSGNCIVDKRSQLVCGKSDECATKGRKCQFSPNKKPDCCSDGNLHCFKGLCSDCKFQGEICATDIDCCNGNCYYKDEGENQLECKATPDKCRKIGMSCQRDLIPSKDCCDGLKCYNSICKECKVEDGEPCETDNVCCSGKCVYNSKGKRVCGTKSECISVQGISCVPDIIPRCCEELECFKGICLKCKVNDKPCKTKEECCTGFCGWDSLGKNLLCRDPYNDCIHANNECDEKEVHDRKTRVCCDGFCVESKCIPCKLDSMNCTNDDECCSAYCNTQLGLCQVKPNCATPGNKCTDLKCCEGVCIGGACQPCLDEGSKCSLHIECCVKHCHYDPKLGTRTCKKPSGTIFPNVPHRCRYKDEVCSDQHKCCINLGYTCINGLCTFPKDPECKTIHLDCLTKEDCCSGLNCSQSKCSLPCSQASHTCEDDEGCCGELRCVNFVCRNPLDPSVPDDASCSHENEECNENIRCCEGIYQLLCERKPGDKYGRCIHPKKDMDCGKADQPCDIANCCCEGFYCSSKSICKKAKIEKDCALENEVCDFKECCESLNCFPDRSGQFKKCTPLRDPPCIQTGGICDDIERTCCSEVCINGRCLGKCSDKGGKCCESDDCCKGLQCVDDTCHESCAQLHKHCSANSDCCNGLKCNPKSKLCSNEDCNEGGSPTEREKGRSSKDVNQEYPFLHKIIESVKSVNDPETTSNSKLRLSVVKSVQSPSKPHSHHHHKRKFARFIQKH